MSQRIGFGDAASASVKKKGSEGSTLKVSGYVKTVCRGPDGVVKWVDEGENIVVDTGIDYILGTAILDSATIYVGLLTATPSPAAGWTMTNAGGAEAAGYDEATRVLWGQGAASAKAVTNATAADFTMDGVDTSIGGAFLTTDSTKDGTAGILIAAKAFTGGDKTVANNDVLSVTYTITGSSSV